MPELVWMPKKERVRFISCRSLVPGSSVFKDSGTFYLCIQHERATRSAALNLRDYSVGYFDFSDKVEVVGHLKSLVIDKIGE